MPNFRTHLKAGVAAGLVLGVVFGYVFDGVVYGASAFLMCSLGSVIPDVDHKHSYVYRSTRSAVTFGCFASCLYFVGRPFWFSFLVAVSASATVYYLVEHVRPPHRGFTHTFAFMGLCSVFVSYFSGVAGAALGAGILSHLLLDGELKLV